MTQVISMYCGSSCVWARPRDTNPTAPQTSRPMSGVIRVPLITVWTTRPRRVRGMRPASRKLAMPSSAPARPTVTMKAVRGRKATCPVSNASTKLRNTPTLADTRSVRRTPAWLTGSSREA